MNLFITGGCKNGKSTFAKSIALSLGGPRYYAATMLPCDAEDKKRIARHRLERRGLGFKTLERPRDIKSILEKRRRGVFLIDSVTALLANEMFTAGGEVVPDVFEKVRGDLLYLCDNTENAIFVSDYIFADLPAQGYTEQFRRGLADIDRALAARCDIVAEVCAGQPVFHKGRI